MNEVQRFLSKAFIEFIDGCGSFMFGRRFETNTTFIFILVLNHITAFSSGTNIYLLL